MGIEKIAVIGAGQMGSGIAQVAAQSGYGVIVFDSFDGANARATATIQKSLAKLEEKKVISESKELIFSRITFVDTLEKLAASKPKLAIEAVAENFDVKAKLFQDLDRVLPQDCLLASNTSSIAITRLAACTKRPEKVCGMHFMNPVPLMKLVELISGLQTSSATFETVKAVAEKMGKTTVTSKDMPGFIVNRILMPMINEAVFALQEGLGTAADIDNGMKLGTNQPMGPLTLADFIGLDTCLAIMEVLFEGLGDSKYRPAPLLKQYVQAGWLGKKSKRGFYTYE